MISIKYVTLNGAQEITLEEGQTVEDVFKLIGQDIDKIGNTRLNGNPASLGSILRDGDVLATLPRLKGEATIPIAGDKWRVHQYDADENFPSDFHAHNQIRPETLDGYTGDIYDPRTRRWLRRMRKKHLDEFRRRIPKRILEKKTL